jgi:uncharacterized protein
MLLRGPQTPGELKSRTERLHPFKDLIAVEDTLDRLARRDEPLVRRLPREPGQKETRTRELLTEAGGEVTAIVPDDAPIAWKPDPAATVSSPAPTHPDTDDGLGERVAALEGDVATLRRELEALRDSLGG